MDSLIANATFALTVTGPIMLVLGLGALLARWNIITDAFIDAGTRLVFNVTLPALLFITVSQTDLGRTANLRLMTVGIVGTLVVFVIAEIVAALVIRPPEDRGVVVQGAYRSNMAIVGLAYCVNAYGEIALAASSLYLGVITVLYNVLAVITLNRSLDRQRSLWTIAAAIMRNPLIIGIVTALPFAYLEVQLPGPLLQTGEYFAQMTLPLALLCAGGSLSLAALQLDSRNALLATFGKVLFYPAALTFLAYLADLRGMDLGIVLLMSLAPTAAASYVMSRAMGANAVLAANIIVLTTLGSILATSVGITLMRQLGLI